MPIIYHQTSIFDSPAHALVNPVNCVGIMGQGLAKEFKARYPQMYRVYREMCRARSLKIGRVARLRLDDIRPQIVLFPTKDHWTHPSHPYYIDEGLRHFCSVLPHWKLSSIAFPALGCGAGGLDWREVQPIMVQHLDKLDLNVYIQIPQSSEEQGP